MQKLVLALLILTTVAACSSEGVKLTPSTRQASQSDTISVSGTTISWPDDGVYQVLRADDNTVACSGGTSCVVEPGIYTVINLTTGQRFENIETSEGANTSTPPATTESPTNQTPDAQTPGEQPPGETTTPEEPPPVELPAGPLSIEQSSALVNDLPDTHPAEQVKKAVLELAIERTRNAMAVDYTDEANALLADIKNSINRNANDFLGPNPRAKNLWGFSAIRTPVNNPYLDAYVSSAEIELSGDDQPFARVTPLQAVFTGLGGVHGSRSAPALARKYFWLFAHEQSPMRFNAELIKRALRRLHTFADLVTVNARVSLGGKHGLWTDQFAIEYAFPAFYEIAELHPGLLLPSQKKSWDNMMQAARSSLGRGSEYVWKNPWNYNIEGARNLGTLNIGLYLNDQAIVDRVLDHADKSMRMQRPDGAMPYHGDDRPSVNYHNVVLGLWAQMYEQTGHEPLREALELSQWKGPSTGRTEEWWTSPFDKAYRWNIQKGTEAGLESIATLTQNPYLRGQLDRNRLLEGVVSGRLGGRDAIIGYDPHIPSLPLPDNYTIADRNIGGPRRWNGEFTYAGSYRPWREGHTTLIGAMTVEPDDGQLNSILAEVTPRVWITPEGENDYSSHARLTEAEVSASIISKHYNIGTIVHGIKRSRGPYAGPVSDWKGRQIWVGLPDRLVGLVSTVPGVDNARGYAVQGVLRLISGGTTGARVLKTLETISPTHYRYGQLDIIVHQNTYNSITGIVVPYRRGSFPATELTFSDRLLEPAEAGEEKSYPANTNYQFVVEIRPTWVASSDSLSISSLGDQELMGLEVVGNDRSFQVWLNTGNDNRVASLMRDRLPTGQDSLAVSQGLLGRPEFQSDIPSQTTLAAGQHAVLVVSDNPEDHANGWYSFADMVGYPDIQVHGDRAFDRVSINTVKEHTFTLVNDSQTPLTLTGSPAIAIEGDSAFSVTQTVDQSLLTNGQNTSFTVRFAPTRAGEYTATLNIASNLTSNENYKVFLTGIGSDEIDLKGSSAYGTSWENPDIWEDGSPASPGRRYFMRRTYENNAILRTPTALDAQFPGDQLNVTDGATILMKQADNGTLSVNRLVFNGGGFVFGSGPLNYTLSGQVLVEENGLFFSNDGTLNFTGPVNGDGPISINWSQVKFNSGNWGGDLVLLKDEANVRFDFDIRNGKSLIFIGGNVDLNGRNHRFQNLYIRGTTMPAGSYSADELGAGFVGDGTISVVPYQRAH